MRDERYTEEVWMCPGCGWADGHAEGCPHDDSNSAEGEAVGYVKSVEPSTRRGSWVIPPGHRNRKARRAQRAAQKRAAWKAFKASQRQSVTLQQVIDEYEKEQAGQWP